MKNILFTICGRAGSKGIKNKNIRDFLGHPLPLYTLSTIDLYLTDHPDCLGNIVLNTDSVQLIEMFRMIHSREIDIIKRAPALGGDTVPKTDVIADCLVKMEEKRGIIYDMVVDLDITSPLRTIEDIDHLIEKKQKTECDVVFSVVDARRNPYFNMVKKDSLGYSKVIDSNYVTRQEAPEIYDMNASMYAFSPAYLKSGKGVFGGYCEIIKMFDTGILDLDHENDFELMEVIAEYLFDVKEGFTLIKENIKNL